MTVEKYLPSKEGCKVIKATLDSELESRYNRFINRLKAVGGGVHGSQSHVFPQPSSNLFLYTVFIFYFVPKDVDVATL